MSSLLARLKAGIKNTRETTFPGTDEKILLRPLSTEESQEAVFAADRMFSKNEVSVQFHNISSYENEKSIQMLYRSCTDLKGDPIAEDIYEFRRLVTNEDRNNLIDEYNALVEECSPSPVEIPAEQFDRLIEQVKKNPQKIGSISSLSMLKRLALFLVKEFLN